MPVYTYVYVNVWVNDNELPQSNGKPQNVAFVEWSRLRTDVRLALPPGNSGCAEETIHTAPGPLGHQHLSSVLVFTGKRLSKETVSPAGLSRWTATCHVLS